MFKNGFKKQTISAIKATKRKTWVVNFRHPLKNIRVSRSLQTRDATEAKGIAVDLERLANSPEFWELSLDSPALFPFHERSLEIFFGKKPERASPMLAVLPEVRDALRVLSEAGLLKHIGKIEVASKDLAEERQLRVKAEQNAIRMKRAQSDLEREVASLRRALNKHITISLRDAIEDFNRIYPQGRSAKTVRDVQTTLSDFQDHINPDVNLGAIKARDIEHWLRDYRNKKNGKEITPVTRRRLKANVSSFFSWAVREHDLCENPMDKTAPVAGIQRHPENIIAIRKLKDLQDLFDGLMPFPYWRAWVATAILAGLRWSEQVWLRVDNVYLEEGYLRVATRATGSEMQGTKTGRERDILIEKTVLLPILKKYLQSHEGKYPWVFPSTLTSKDHLRTKTEAGQWAENMNFKQAWRKVALKAKNESKNKGEFWGFGPSIWRHTFGTALAMGGFLPLDIAKLMGNSPAIAERHYIGLYSREAGKRWPFRWH